MHNVLGYELAQALIVMDQVFDLEVSKPRALRPVEYTLLALVAANPDVTARQLARGLAVTPPNIAVWLEKLELRDLVVRRRSTRDARVQHVRLTAAGNALAKSSTQALLAGEAAVLAPLSPAERAILIELLHKVARLRKRTVRG